jgi:hypothetical protein
MFGRIRKGAFHLFFPINHPGVFMKKFLVLSCFTFLAACGGGGDGGSTTPVGPSASTSAFALDTAASKFFTEARSFSLNGQVDGRNLNITLAYQPQLDETFEGQASRVNLNTLTIRENNSVILTDTVKRYFSVNPFLLRGATLTGDPDGQNYFVVQTSSVLPASANVGSTGPLAQGRFFTDSSSTTQRGSEVVTYSLEADTASTAFFCLNSTTRDEFNTILVTESQCAKITPEGNILGLKLTIGDYSNGTFVRTLTFR